MPLTKREIIDRLYEKAGLTRKECSSVMESTLDIIKDELGKGNTVKISGFGKWNVLNKKARKGRNPQNGKAITISARKVVTFKPSKVLNTELNKGD